MMERVMDIKLQDKKLICCDCGAQITLTTGRLKIMAIGSLDSIGE